MLTMIVALAVAGLVLVLATQGGVWLIQRAFPPDGRMIDVAGARLHVVELGSRDAAGPPVVLLHGASSNLHVMLPLGEKVSANNHRVILIDRPGHGWSTRERATDSTPAIQGRMIMEALSRLGVNSAIVVTHSWAGALGLRIALDYPDRVAGLVLLAPVAYPWRGGVGRYNDVIATPLIGPLLAHTITLPFGWFVLAAGARNVFAPQPMPVDFVQDSATPLVLRPCEFIANAHDLVTLKAAVAAQAPRYAGIRVPLTIISGDADETVFTSIHARPLAATVPHAKLIVLPGVGHMVQYAAPDLVVSEIEAMAGQVAHRVVTAQ